MLIQDNPVDSKIKGIAVYVRLMGHILYGYGAVYKPNSVLYGKTVLIWNIYDSYSGKIL